MQGAFQVTKRGTLDPEAETLPPEPPPLIARSIAWLIIALFLSTLVAAIFVRIPETVRCPFILVPGDGADQLARLDATPRARLLLKERDLSKLAVGQRVRLCFDAFPYQRYGTITAKLDSISSAAVAPSEAQSFVALTSLDQTSMRVGGEARPLRVGMRGEARIGVGSRTLIEYAFEPIRQLRENIRR
jgi:hypothetical protein